jgi:hypothetical protein
MHSGPAAHFTGSPLDQVVRGLPPSLTSYWWLLLRLRIRPEQLRDSFDDAHAREATIMSDAMIAA